QHEAEDERRSRGSDRGGHPQQAHPHHRRDDEGQREGPTHPRHPRRCAMSAIRSAAIVPIVTTSRASARSGPTARRASSANATPNTPGESSRHPAPLGKLDDTRDASDVPAILPAARAAAYRPPRSSASVDTNVLAPASSSTTATNGWRTYRMSSRMPSRAAPASMCQAAPARNPPSSADNDR